MAKLLLFFLGIVNRPDDEAPAFDTCQWWRHDPESFRHDDVVVSCDGVRKWAASIKQIFLTFIQCTYFHRKSNVLNSPASFSFIFVFSNKHYNFTANKCEKCLVWPHLAKYCHSSTMLKNFGHFKWVDLVLSKNLSLLWQIIIVENGQIQKI